MRLVDDVQYWRRLATLRFRHDPVDLAGIRLARQRAARPLGLAGRRSRGLVQLCGGVKSPAVDAMIDALLAATAREDFVAAVRALDRVAPVRLLRRAAVLCRRFLARLPGRSASRRRRCPSSARPSTPGGASADASRVRAFAPSFRWVSDSRRGGSDGRMMALGLADESSPAHDEVLPEVRLSDILAAAAEREPQRLAIADEPGREAWSGRPRIAWTCASSHHVVERLAAFLNMLDLRPGTSVAICLPNGSEACDRASRGRAGRPRAVPLPGRLGRGGDGPRACGGGRRSGDLPGLRRRGAAGRGLLPPFGTLAAPSRRLRLRTARAGRGDRPRPGDPRHADGRRPAPAGRTGRRRHLRGARRGSRTAVPSLPLGSDGGGGLLATQAILPDERLCTLLAPDDHASLTTGLVASLLAGVTLECLGLPDGAAIVRALDPPGPTHLVAPAFLEAALAQAGLPDPRIRTVLVHRPPLRFGGRASSAAASPMSSPSANGLPRACAQSGRAHRPLARRGDTRRAVAPRHPARGRRRDRVRRRRRRGRAVRARRAAGAGSALAPFRFQGRPFRRDRIGVR